MYVTYFDSKLELDVTDKIFIVPTGDQTKLPKYNEWTLDGLHTGYITETLIPSYDENVGLYFGEMWVAVADLTNNVIDYYVFSQAPDSIDITASGGLITTATINTNTLIWHDCVLWANIAADSDADNRPDYFDPDVEGSVSWLLGSVGSNSESYSQLYTKGGEAFVTSDGEFMAVRR